MDAPSAVVTVHVWGLDRVRDVPVALGRMGLDRLAMARSGAAFHKLLGTGAGRTFTWRDADPRHWALLATWPDEAAAQRFEDSRTVRAWDALAGERLRLRLRPLASRGRWSGRAPFGDPVPHRHEGPVAAITRARIRAGKTVTFHRAVPPVSADLHRTPGLRWAIGVGEAPVGLQGTLSLWQDAASLRGFAHAREPHLEAVRATAREDWYAEELFARFAVLSVDGTHAGREP